RPRGDAHGAPALPDHEAQGMAALPAVMALVLAAEPAASDVKNDGKIDAVVVFQDRARVTRTHAARCEHGKASAQFEHLPDALDTRTLRGEARDGGEVIGLSSQSTGATEPSDPRAASLEAQRLKVQAAIRDEEARRAELGADLERLAAY